MNFVADSVTRHYGGSQSRAADETGVPQTAISRWKTGDFKRQPPMDRVRRFLDHRSHDAAYQRAGYRAAGYPLPDGVGEGLPPVVDLEDLLESDAEITTEERITIEEILTSFRANKRVSVAKQHVRSAPGITEQARYNILAILDGHPPRPSRSPRPRH